MNSREVGLRSKRTPSLSRAVCSLVPGYVQACRALMIAASVLGLPAILLLLTVLPCIRMGHEPGVAKYRRAQLAGVLLILLGKLSLWLPHSSECEGARILELLLQEKCEKGQEDILGNRNP